MSGARSLGRLPTLIVIPLAIVLSGCGALAKVLVIAQSLDARPVAVIARERLPLNAAVFVPEDEFGAEVPPFNYAGALGTTRHFRLRPLKHLQEVLLLSLPRIFERVTPARTLPEPGRYAVVLVPRITDMRVGFKFIVAGTLRVLDDRGKELATTTDEGQAAGRASRTPSINEGTVRVVSQAIGDIVRKWVEQLFRSVDPNSDHKSEARVKFQSLGHSAARRPLQPLEYFGESAAVTKHGLESPWGHQTWNRFSAEARPEGFFPRPFRRPAPAPSAGKSAKSSAAQASGMPTAYGQRPGHLPMMGKRGFLA